MFESCENMTVSVQNGSSNLKQRKYAFCMNIDRSTKPSLEMKIFANFLSFRPTCTSCISHHARKRARTCTHTHTHTHTQSSLPAACAAAIHLLWRWDKSTIWKRWWHLYRGRGLYWHACCSGPRSASSAQSAELSSSSPAGASQLCPLWRVARGVCLTAQSSWEQKPVLIMHHDPRSECNAHFASLAVVHLAAVSSFFIYTHTAIHINTHKPPSSSTLTNAPPATHTHNTLLQGVWFIWLLFFFGTNSSFTPAPSTHLSMYPPPPPPQHTHTHKHTQVHTYKVHTREYYFILFLRAEFHLIPMRWNSALKNKMK